MTLRTRYTRKMVQPAYQPVIGIDLGTTYTCAGLWTEQGRVEILEDEQGRRTFPSYVSYEAGRCVVGEAAREAAFNHQPNVAYDIKRLIGRQFDDPNVERLRETWPFEVLADDSKRCRIRFDGNGAAPDAPTLFPEEISAVVLEKMKALAEARLGGR